MKLGIQIPSYYTEQNMFSLAILFIEKHIFVYWQSPDHHLDHHLAQFVHTASIGSTQGEAEQMSMPVNAVKPGSEHANDSYNDIFTYLAPQHSYLLNIHISRTAAFIFT